MKLMGTNYYLKIHLGKSSADREPHGTFYWAVDPAILSMQRGEAVILDEYGAEHDINDWLRIRQRQDNDLRHIGEDFG